MNIEKILNFFIPSKINEEELFTNKLLLKELNECFLWNLKVESVGNKMLYPMSFNVLLHPNDFEQRKPALPFIIREIVNNFYDTIKTQQSEFPDIEPTASKWNFQFSSSEKIFIDENNILEIQQGKPYVIAQLYSVSHGNFGKSTNTRVSYKPKNSDNYSTYNINKDIFKNLDIYGEGIFCFSFDKSLKHLSQSPKHLGESIAKISYTEGNNIVHFAMIDNEIGISGKNDSRNESWVLKVNSTEVLNNHVLIRYDTGKNIFEIAAYGTLRVGERSIPHSSGGDVKWFPLSKKAKLLINNFIPMDFNASV